MRAQMTIRGRVIDTLQAPLAIASVFLLDDADSTLMDFVRSEEDGSFIFKNVSRRSYILKLNYVGFLPVQIFISNEKKEIDLGNIELSPISKELFEVIIREAKAPLTMRGDTIEYDASTFKVPQGSSVEELLRKLPGIEVDAEGGIKAEGRDIKRVTVDGKRFFGGDPKAATKNLPAEGVKKVQVFTDQTEEQKLSSSKATADKAMNIELKEEFKKGGFGKVTAGVGTEQTAELKANYNKFNSKEQISLIGVASNTGRNGLGWNDYQDFKGSNSFNWDDNDEFGFGTGGGMRFLRFFSSDDDDENLSENFFGGGASGFPKKLSGGINYNYDHKKSDLSTSYFYSFNNLQSTSIDNSEFTLPSRFYTSNSTLNKDRSTMNHALTLRYEHEIDSFNSVVLISNANIGDVNTDTKNQVNTLTPLTQEASQSKQVNDLNADVTKWNNSLIYRKKFRKKGRKFSISGGYNRVDNNRSYDQINEYTFTLVNPIRDSLSAYHQLTKSATDKQLIKSSGLYVEPIRGKFFIQGFYNINQRSEDFDRPIYDIAKDLIQRQNDSLSRISNQQATTYRIGTSLRYAVEGINIAIGLAGQQMDVVGDFYYKDNLPYGPRITNRYKNVLPYFNADYEMKGNRNFGLSYEKSVEDLNFSVMQAITDYTNPIYISKGNPDLKPEVKHAARLNYYHFNPSTFINANANINYSISENNIIRKQSTNAFNISETQSINYKDSKEWSLWASYGFPIIKNKFTLNFNVNGSITNGYVLINDVEGISKSGYTGGGLRINYTPNDNLSCFINTRINTNQTRFINSTLENSQVLTQNHSVDLNYKFPLDIFINSNFRYNLYQDRDNKLSRAVPLLNFSLYRIFLKSKKAELRLSAYDVFNKNIGINQWVSGNQKSETRTETLARYIMLSMSYNMRGIKTSLKKNSGWWE